MTMSVVKCWERERKVELELGARRKSLSQATWDQVAGGRDSIKHSAEDTRFSVSLKKVPTFFGGASRGRSAAQAILSEFPANTCVTYLGGLLCRQLC